MNNDRDRVHSSESNHEPDETLDQVPAQADPPVAPPSSADEPTLAPESRPASDSWSSPQSETGSTNVTAASEQPTIAPNWPQLQDLRYRNKEGVLFQRQVQQPVRKTYRLYLGR